MRGYENNYMSNLYFIGLLLNNRIRGGESQNKKTDLLPVLMGLPIKNAFRTIIEEELVKCSF